MANRKLPKVNTYDAELKFEKIVEQAQKNPYIRKPVSWSLYQTWKWANQNEEERKNERHD